MHLNYTYFTYNSSALVGSEFGGTSVDPGRVFFEFAVKRALKQDQILHMEGKHQAILYFSRECTVFWFIFFTIYILSRVCIYVVLKDHLQVHFYEFCIHFYRVSVSFELKHCYIILFKNTF